DEVHLARTSSIAGIRVVARSRSRIAAGRAGRLEAVVVADTRKAGVLVRARGPCIAAARAVGDVVNLARSCAVARICVVARSARRIAARRPGRLESVVVTSTRETGVLVRARRPRIAAARAVGDVVDLTGARSVAGVGVVARSARRIAARSPGRLETVVVTETG